MSAASEKITQFENDISLANQIVNGDESTDVAVESGSCPTFRKTIATMTAAGTGVVDQAQVSAASAAASEVKAEQWAVGDGEIEPGLMSAKHYAEYASSVTGIVPATETEAGIIEVANEPETLAGTVDNKAVSPKNLKSWEADKSTPTPTLSMDATVAEGVTVNGTYTIESGASAVWSIPSDIATFVDNGDGTFNLTAPNVDVDTDYTIGLAAKKPDDKFQSDQVTSTITVIDVVVQDGPTVVFADADGWDVAPVDGSIAAPSTSVGADNTNQIVSAQPEVTQTSGKLTLLDGTTESVLKLAMLVAAGDVLITDQGECVVASVSTDPSPVSYKDYKLKVDSGFTGGDVCLAEFELLKEGVDQIPTMTAETTSGCTITATDYLTTNYPYNVGADNINVVWASLNDAFPKELFISFESDTEIDAYSIDPYAADRAAGEFELWGKKDGSSTWELIDSRTELTGSTDKKTYNVAAYTYSATLVQALAGIPTIAYKKDTGVTLKIGAGATGEYLGPEKALVLSSTTPSTTTEVIVESEESVKDQILTTGGLHNNLLVDNTLVVANGATETVILYSKQNEFPVESAGTSLGSAYQSWLINKSDKITGVPTINGIGLKSADMMVPGDGYLGLFKDNTDGTLTLVKRVSLVHSGGGSFDVVEFGTAYTADPIASYMIGVANVASAKYIHITSNKQRLSYAFSEGSPVEGTTFTPNTVADGSSPMFCYSTPSSKIITTVDIPEQGQVPTEVAIPNRCTLVPSSYSAVIDGDNLKLTGEEIALEDNPTLKRLAMKVEGEGLTFKSGKIYIKEVI